MGMRKRILGEQPPGERTWLDLDRLAEVEITSEDPAHPIEHALDGGASGWRASTPGEQIVRLLFSAPIDVRAMDLRFDENDEARTQEFVLRWSADGGRSYREIIRQQYSFSPPGTTREAEHYAVDLRGVTALELRVIPDVGGGAARASLSSLRLA
jgi:hypothetical protein